MQTVKYNISSNLFKCARNGSHYVWKWKLPFGFNKAKTIDFARNFELLRMQKGASVSAVIVNTRHFTYTTIRDLY